DLRDYDELFTEKLDLLLAIRDNERVTWQGEHRAPLADAIVWPRPVQDQLPVWVAVGGSPESVVRAASRGLPLALAIIGGQTARFRPFVDLYRHAWAETGQVGEPRVAVNTHAFIANSHQEADAAFVATSPRREEDTDRWQRGARRSQGSSRTVTGALARPSARTDPRRPRLSGSTTTARTSASTAPAAGRRSPTSSAIHERPSPSYPP